MLYVLDDANSNKDFCASALILTSSHIPLLISVAEFDTFTVSNMQKSMSNTLCFKAQAQIAALPNGWCHKWLINTLSCASLRVDFCADTALFFAHVRLLHGHKLSLFYAIYAISAGRRDNSSVPLECWQTSPPASLLLVIKTNCFISLPEQSLPDLIVLWNNSNIPLNFNLQL